MVQNTLISAAAISSGFFFNKSFKIQCRINLRLISNAPQPRVAGGCHVSIWLLRSRRGCVYNHNLRSSSWVQKSVQASFKGEGPEMKTEVKLPTTSRGQDCCACSQGCLCPRPNCTPEREGVFAGYYPVPGHQITRLTQKRANAPARRGGCSLGRPEVAPGQWGAPSPTPPAARETHRLPNVEMFVSGAVRRALAGGGQGDRNQPQRGVGGSAASALANTPTTPALISLAMLGGPPLRGSFSLPPQSALRARESEPNRARMWTQPCGP